MSLKAKMHQSNLRHEYDCVNLHTEGEILQYLARNTASSSAHCYDMIFWKAK